MARKNKFTQVGSLNPGRSAFDLSYSKLMTCDMGTLNVVCAEECVPGDLWTIGNQAVVRMQPMVAPILHEIDITTHYFFYPNRLRDGSRCATPDSFDWEEFITGGEDGDDASTIPVWEPTDTTVGSLWDQFGFPTGVDPDGAYPVQFPLNGVNEIWNEYYRDEWIQDPVDLDQEAVLYRNWAKDYFTSALPYQQRGTAPALPISGSTSAVFPSATFPVAAGGAALQAGTGVADYQIYSNNNANAAANLYGAFNNNTVDLSSATTFDVADLRLAFQIQKWMERNARCGVRYTEFLHAHFGVAPRDDRLDRPEYIGGSKAPIIVSEVLQTSESNTTPQGTLAGHGISANSQFCGKYHVKEYGWIIGIMSIMPKPMYMQGINRQFIKRSRYDYYFPEFANLSEQAIERAEIYASDVDTENQTIFGYQGRYDEMRYKPNLVTGLFRTDFDYWHLGRIFASAPALNDTFLKCVPDTRIFAVESTPGFMVQYGNLLKAVRPIPSMGAPGFIDHN